MELITEKIIFLYDLMGDEQGIFQAPRKLPFSTMRHPAVLPVATNGPA